MANTLWHLANEPPRERTQPLLLATKTTWRDKDGKMLQGISPTAADLRESGQIEQDADAIILLAQNVTTKKRPEPHYHFALEKNKEGNVGSLDITFQMETQQFKECVWM